MTDTWTDPIDRVLGERISPSIWNANIAANLRLLKQHSHTGVDGDGALLGDTTVRSGNTTLFVPSIPGTAGPNVLVSANNQVRFFRFYLPFTLSLGFMTCNVTTLLAGSTLGVGLYDVTGATQLVAATASSASTGVKRIAVTTTLLTPNFYILAWTNTSTTPAWGSWSALHSSVRDVYIDTSPIYGTAANPSVAGVLPAALGALTGVSVDIGAVRLEGA